MSKDELGQTSIELLHEHAHEYFWDRVYLVKKRIGKPVTDLVLDLVAGRISTKEAFRRVSESGAYMESLLLLALEVDRLFWRADYHGLDSSGNSCSCTLQTHEKRTYPVIMRKLETLEKQLVVLVGKV